MIQEYFLMDLERTIAHGEPYFWKANKFGYTTHIQFAGLFSKEEAEKIVKEDKSNTTAIVHYQMVSESRALTMKAHEGN